MTPADPRKLVGEVAQLLTDTLGLLPPGVEVVAFVLAYDGEKLDGQLMSSLDWAFVAPMMREWLRRYEAGEIKQEGRA